jgi:hypothetical protein
MQKFFELRPLYHYIINFCLRLSLVVVLGVGLNAFHGEDELHVRGLMHVLHPELLGLRLGPLLVVLEALAVPEVVQVLLLVEHVSLQLSFPLPDILLLNELPELLILDAFE